MEEFTSIVKVTEHGLERLMSRGFEANEIVSLVTKPDYIKIQSDGAKVFIEQVANHKYNAMIVNEQTGKVVTALRQVSLNKIIKLGNNYGWSL